MNSFLKGSGVALLIGAVTLILMNIFLTPAYMASFQEGEAIARSSQIYFIRLSVALIIALLLLYGSIGLHLVQANKAGLFGKIAFLIAFVGNSLLFAVEWSNLFILRAVAQTSPETFLELNESLLMTTGFAVGIGIFSLGWLLFSVSIWRTNIFPRWTGLLTLVGLILIPILGITPLGITGQVVGNAIFGLGLSSLGYFLYKTKSNSGFSVSE